MPLTALRRGGALRTAIWDHVQPRAVDLRRDGDPAHRDSVGLQTEARRLLHQPLPASQDNKQGKKDADEPEKKECNAVSIG